MPKERKLKRPWRYTPSASVRKHIAKWEGSDFDLQNKQFGGDAITAKAQEFSNMMKDLGLHLTSKELDGLFSTFYNLRPSTFKDRIMPHVQKYAMETNEANAMALQDVLQNRYTWAEKQYQKGIRNRAAADVSLMGFPLHRRPNLEGSTNFPIDWTLVDNPQLSTPILPKENPVPLENKPYQFQQVAVQMPKKDVYNAFDQAAVAYGNEPESPFRLRLRMPTLNDLMAMDSPDEQLKRQIKEMLPMPNVQLKMPVFKNGKLPGYEDGDVSEGTKADASWHEWWLNNRKQQMQENMNTNIRYKYMDNWTAQNQIKRLQNTSEEETNLPEGNFGLSNNGKIYYDMGQVNSYNGSRPDVNINSVKIHERTHSMQPLPQQDKIEKIGGLNTVDNPYIDDPSEVYAGLMEQRYRLGLKPDYTVTPEDIRKWREQKQLNQYLENKSDDVLLQYFNDVAYIKNKDIQDKLPMAKNGKCPIKSKKK